MPTKVFRRGHVWGDHPAWHAADTDDRVVPMHSFKYAAALQHAQAGSAQILLRVETRAGHGAGLPISKKIDQSADNWAFLWKSLGME